MTGPLLLLQLAADSSGVDADIVDADHMVLQWCKEALGNMCKVLVVLGGVSCMMSEAVEGEESRDEVWGRWSACCGGADEGA